MIQSIKTTEWILLDFGNVICGFNYNPFISFIQNNSKYSQEYIQNQIFKPNGLLDLYETGALNTNEFISSIRNLLSTKLENKKIVNTFSNIFEEWHVSLETLSILSNKFKIALLSNTNEIHFKNTIAPLTNPYIDIYMLSYHIGIKKPNKIFFETFLKDTNAIPDKCLFFDDLEQNINTALNIGIPSILESGPTGLRDSCLKLGLI